MQFSEPAFRHRLFPSFYPQAHLLRQRVEQFFGTPAMHGPQHQVFDVWVVPDHYYYFRTNAVNVLGELYEPWHAFMCAHAQGLGMSRVTHAFLSLYLPGCHQNVHSDAMNGTYGFVYSLTEWENRCFTGGETAIARDGSFDRLEPRDHKGAATYWEMIPSRFNQLLLFDDRVAHMVPTVQGTVDPLKSRIVLHGHLS